MSEELLTKDMIEVDVDWEKSGSQVRWRYKEQYRDEDDEEWRGTPFQRYQFWHEREMIEQVADWLDGTKPRADSPTEWTLKLVSQLLTRDYPDNGTEIA